MSAEIQKDVCKDAARETELAEAAADEAARGAEAARKGVEDLRAYHAHHLHTVQHGLLGGGRHSEVHQRAANGDRARHAPSCQTRHTIRPRHGPGLRSVAQRQLDDLLLLQPVLVDA